VRPPAESTGGPFCRLCPRHNALLKLPYADLLYDQSLSNVGRGPTLGTSVGVSIWRRVFSDVTALTYFSLVQFYFYRVIVENSVKTTSMREERRESLTVSSVQITVDV